MTVDCYDHLARVLEQGAAVLATVVAITGSVPREVGAKMVICPDGQIFGTVGGGAGEAKVIRQAMIVLATGKNQWVEIDLTGAAHRETEGICGGRMQVWLEHWSGAAAIALVQTMLNRLRSGQPVTLVTSFSTDLPPYLMENSCIDTDSSSSLHASPLGDSSDPTQAFIETIQPPPTLLIVGAGHVGLQLAKVASPLGFQVVVQDDRSEWANSHHYPQAALICNQPIDAVMPLLAHHTQLYAALVTRGYQYDLTALQALLHRSNPCRYIGMIGSKRRVQQVLHAIEKDGYEELPMNSIHAPIGLDIGALTPEEIAISIAAELILVRRGGTGRPLSIHLREP